MIQNSPLFAIKVQHIVILAKDHIYKMDYSRMLLDHVEVNVKCTIWRANLDLASVTLELDMHDHTSPIRTHMEPLLAAKFVQDRPGSHGMMMNSLISGGTIISGSVVINSVLFPRVRINSFCNIDSTVLLADVIVGRSCRLRRGVIDRACVLPEGMVIGENPDEDSRRFYRSEEGIVLVTRAMLARA